MNKPTKYESVANWQYELLSLYQIAFAEIKDLTEGKDDLQTAFSDAEYFIFSKQDKLIANSTPDEKLLAQIAKAEKQIKDLTLQLVKDLKAEIANSKLAKNQKGKLFRRCLRVCNLPPHISKRLERAKSKRAKQLRKKLRNHRIIISMLRDNVAHTRYLATIKPKKKLSERTLTKKIEALLGEVDTEFRIAYALEVGEITGYHYHLLLTSQDQYDQIRSLCKCKRYNLSFNADPVTDTKVSYYNLAEYVTKSGKLCKFTRKKTKINPHFPKGSKVKK